MAKTNPITLAVAPLRASAMENAEKYARAAVAKATEELAAAGNDLEKVAPYPDSRMGKFQYVAARERSAFFSSICAHRQSSYRRGEPRLADISPEHVERFVSMQKHAAVVSFDGYVIKLIGKIGDDVSAAALRGIDQTNLWARSELTITRPDGSVEKWLTQQIWNVSVLGKAFPQWPTRQTAGAKREIVKKVPLVHMAREGRSYMKLCAHSCSMTGSTGNIVTDASKVTCPRCLKWMGLRAKQAASAAGSAS